MFFRVKPAGDRRYLQIVENTRDGAKTRQTVVATLGRLDELEASGKLDVLLRSGARLCETAMLVSSLRQGTLDAVSTRRSRTSSLPEASSSSRRPRVATTVCRVLAPSRRFSTICR